MAVKNKKIIKENKLRINHFQEDMGELFPNYKPRNYSDCSDSEDSAHEKEKDRKKSKSK